MWRWVHGVLVAAMLAGACKTALADDDLPLPGKAGDFTLAAPEVSEDPTSGWYLRADGGYVAPAGGRVSVGPFPVSQDVGGAGWSVGAGIGYRFLPMLRAEVGLDYLALGSAASPFGEFRANATVGLASLAWDVITVAGFTPYVTAGAGFAITGMDAPGAFATSTNHWGFAWSVGGGVSYALSGALAIDLGYRYISLGAPELSSPGLPLSAGELAAHQIRLGIRYALN